MEQLDLKLIERYFEGDLDEQELALVAKKLQEDPAFAEAFQLEEDLFSGIEAAGNQQLRERLEGIHQEEAGKETPIRQLRPRILRWEWIAAAVLLGVVMLARVLFDRPASPQQLYAIYAVHDFDFTEKGGAETELAKAEQLLKEKKYAEALPVLEGYLVQHPDDAQAVMARGVAWMETGKVEDALGVFEQVRINSPLLENEASWYIALACLKTGDLERTKQVLLTIPSESYRHKDARRLADKVE